MNNFEPNQQHGIGGAFQSLVAAPLVASWDACASPARRLAVLHVVALNIVPERMPFDALTLLHTPLGGTRRARMVCAMEAAKAFDAVVLHYSYLRDPRMSRASFTPPVEPIAQPRVATFDEVVPWMKELAACIEALDAWGHSEATARDETVDWIRSHWKRTVSLFVGNPAPQEVPLDCTSADAIEIVRIRAGIVLALYESRDFARIEELVECTMYVIERELLRSHFESRLIEPAILCVVDASDRAVLDACFPGMRGEAIEPVDDVTALRRELQQSIAQLRSALV